MTEKPPLLILGASARACAMSALRAGFQPLCGDLFADADLRNIARVERVHDYPRELAAVANQFEPCDWMYVGALENYPRTISQVSQRHRLLGNPPEVVRAVRNPFRLTEFLRGHGLPVLDVLPGHQPPRTGNWLRKPLRSAAGLGIRVVGPSGASSGSPPSTSRSTVYFQARGTGDSLSAIFVASPERTRLVGVTRQLIGVPDWHATEFGYCGSIGPLELPAREQATVEQIGRMLADGFRLRGLFGFDFLCGPEGLRLTEVNPRYTAAVEVLEWASGEALIAEHAVACGRGDRPPCVASPYSPLDRPVLGKAIVFAGGAVTVGKLEPVTETGGPPLIADIPAAGTQIQPGEPICTVFATGTSIDDCRERLNLRVTEMRNRFQ